MSQTLPPPRLVAPSAADAARAMRTASEEVGQALIAAVKRVLPPGQDIQFVVTMRRGKVRVRFEPAPVHEPGWVDA